MVTLFDIVTVASFCGLVLAFFFLTERDHRTLLHFGVSGIVLAVANQVGNAGQTIFALVLVIAGIGYAAVIAWRPAS
jgi:TM2 domain-containing membrane protein YozV